MDRIQRTDAADALCVSAYAASGAPETGCALVAVGGYGRRELAPYSDLDVVLVHEPEVDLGAAGEKVWYPIWDSGAKLDHSVRTAPDMMQQADADLRVALGLLDLRHLAGDPNLTLRLRSSILAHWRRTSRDRLPGLRALVAKRHDLMGELAHLSVPDLKESEGGLRDATVLKALVATWLVDVPHADLERSRLALLEVRDALHAAAGRGTDRVAPEMWGELAERLGLVDEAAAQRHVRELGRRITHLSRLTWRRVDGVLARPAHGGVGAATGPAAGRAGRRPGGWRGGAHARRRGQRPTRPCCCARRPSPPSATWSWPRRPRPASSRRARRCRTRGRRRPARRWYGCSRPGPACCRSGRRSRRRVRWTPYSRSGSGSGCSRTRRRSTASPSTVTSSRRAWRRLP